MTDKQAKVLKALKLANGQSESFDTCYGVERGWSSLADVMAQAVRAGLSSPYQIATRDLLWLTKNRLAEAQPLLTKVGTPRKVAPRFMFRAV